MILSSNGIQCILGLRSSRTPKPKPSSETKCLYACKIKETTNAGRRGPCGQARQTLEVFAQRRIERNVQIDEQNGASQNGQDQAQEIAHEKAKAALRSNL